MNERKLESNSEYQTLFTPEEKKIAVKRLKDLGYNK